MVRRSTKVTPDVPKSPDKNREANASSRDYAAIAGVLRKVAKARGWTYAKLAERLGVSEQTVKRLFNGGDAPVSRLAQVCEALGTSFVEIVKLVDEPPDRFYHLTLAQEAFFAENPAYFAFFTLLRERVTVDAIAERYGLTPDSVYKYLRALDRLGLIELHPGNKVKLLVEGGLRLLRGGPIMKRQGAAMFKDIHEFFASPESDNELSRIMAREVRMTRKTLLELKRELEELASRYRRRALRETELVPEKDLVDAAWLLALAAPYKHDWPGDVPNL